MTYGIDYSETFSPVAKIDIIRVLFSIAANKEWPSVSCEKTSFFMGVDKCVQKLHKDIITSSIMENGH